MVAFANGGGGSVAEEPVILMPHSPIQVGKTTPGTTLPQPKVGPISTPVIKAPPPVIPAVKEVLSTTPKVGLTAKLSTGIGVVGGAPPVPITTNLTAKLTSSSPAENPTSTVSIPPPIPPGGFLATLVGPVETQLLDSTLENTEEIATKKETTAQASANEQAAFATAVNNNVVGSTEAALENNPLTNAAVGEAEETTVHQAQAAAQSVAGQGSAAITAAVTGQPASAATVATGPSPLIVIGIAAAIGVVGLVTIAIFHHARKGSQGSRAPAS